MLPEYRMPQEAEEFQRFRSGERFAGPFEDCWTGLIHGRRTNGRTLGRVHVVRRPLSDYLRFEFQRYCAHSARAGGNGGPRTAERPEPGPSESPSRHRKSCTGSADNSPTPPPCPVRGRSAGATPVA
ncbi:DUF6879 family protein [Kitasatospora cineracea]|uniref:DUF6879 family protein n=1 Tax=Kitasatospora cineracea TaxID=88074 RepID=UPI003CC61D2F